MAITKLGAAVAVSAAEAAAQFLDSGSESESDSTSDDDDGGEEDHVIAQVVVGRKRKLVACFAADVAASRNRLGPQGANTKLKRGEAFDWATHCRKLHSRDFRLRYRMDEYAFDQLLDEIHDEIAVTDTAQARRSRSTVGPTPVEAKLAITLHYLAGGQVCDLVLVYSPPCKSSIYKITWQVIDAINNHDKCKIQYPTDDVARLKEIRGRVQPHIPGGQLGGMCGRRRREAFQAGEPRDRSARSKAVQCSTERRA